jgi:hypothetical protein
VSFLEKSLSLRYKNNEALKTENMKNSILKYYKWFIVTIWAALTLTVYSQFVNVCPLYESTSFAALFLLVTYRPITC